MVADVIGARMYRKTTWREGTRRSLSSKFAAVRVRVVREKGVDDSEQWLVIERSGVGAPPEHYVLSTLPKSLSRKALSISLQVSSSYFPLSATNPVLEAWPGQLWFRIPGCRFPSSSLKLATGDQQRELEMGRAPRGRTWGSSMKLPTAMGSPRRPRVQITNEPATSCTRQCQQHSRDSSATKKVSGSAHL